VSQIDPVDSQYGSNM